MDKKTITAKQIIVQCNGILLTGNVDTIVEDYAYDSRKIKEDDMYVAIKGDNVDGSDYIKEAFDKGAIGCITEAVLSKEILDKYKEKIIIKVDNVIESIQKLAKYKRSLYDIPVIAITGSVGKTSTKDMVSSVLEQRYNVLKTEGNLNNHIGLPMTLLKLKEHTAVVVEMGMNHFGEIQLLTEIAQPTVAVITNIGTSHIGNLGSRENILKAKLEILKGLKDNGIVLINNDNDLLMKWKENEIKHNIYTYGIESKSDYKAIDVIESDSNSEYCIKIKDKMCKVNVPVPGEHFIYNSLCAISIGDLLKIDDESILKGIKEFKLTSKRMEIKKLKNNVLIIEDCYNASYDSMKAALQVLKNVKEKRKIAVLGDMLELGEYSKKLHENVGEEVVNNDIDILITVGELSKDIAKKAKNLKMDNVYECVNNEEAVTKLTKLINEGDAILLKASNRMNFSEILNKLNEVIK